jgi:spore coat protein U-like protein
MRRHLALNALALAVAALPGPAAAAISCSAGIGSLNFGTYSPLSPAGISMLLGEVDITCSNDKKGKGEVVKIRPGISAGNSGNVAQRQMKSGTTALLYNLYRDAAYSTIWTDGPGAPSYDLLVASGASAQLRLPVFGRVPGGQSGALPGAYFDTLVLSIRY